MGLEGNGNSNKRYVTVVGGNFTIRVPKGTEGAVERTLTATGYEGKIVNELQFPRLRGKITNIGYKKGNFGEVIEVTVTDDVDYILQIPWNTSLKNVITRLPNVNYNEEICFYTFKNDDERNVLLIYQGKNEDKKDKLVVQAHTKDAPNGMPPAVEETERGVTKWSFKAVDEFLYALLVKEIEKVIALKPEADANATGSPA